MKTAIIAPTLKSAARLGERLGREKGTLAMLDADIRAGERAQPGQSFCVFVRRRECAERVAALKKEVAALGASRKPDMDRVAAALKQLIDAAENMPGCRSGDLVNALDFGRLVLHEEGKLHA